MFKKIENISNINLEIPSEFYVVCCMTTQAAFSIDVKISDTEGVELFSHTEQSIKAIPIFSADFTTTLENPVLSINIPQSVNLDARFDYLDILGSDSQLKVRTYVVVAEDSTDADYNDLHLVITAYRNRD